MDMLYFGAFLRIVYATSKDYDTTRNTKQQKTHLSLPKIYPLFILPQIRNEPEKYVQSSITYPRIVQFFKTLSKK